MSCLVSDSEVIVHITSAYHIGPLRQTYENSRYVFIKFENWFIKQKIQDIVREQPNVEIED